MQVMDIVNRAAMNCGVASSFNPDEVPEDIQARGADILRHEIIPMMNCDRSLDITETVYPAVPENGVVNLTPTPPDYTEFILGQTSKTYEMLTRKQKITLGPVSFEYYPEIRTLLIDHGYIEPSAPTEDIHTPKYPCDQFGNDRKVFVWTADNVLLDVSTPSAVDRPPESLVDNRYNIPFDPMRVEAVVRADDGAPLQYLHTEEMVTAEFRHSPMVYAVEDLPGRLSIRVNPELGNARLLLVLPIPLKIVNSFDEPNPWQGTIVAPEKFRSYLIAKLAYRLAVEYGLDTAQLMSQLVSEAYQALIKNLSKRHRSQDIPLRVSEYLGRGVNGRFFGKLDGYGGY